MSPRLIRLSKGAPKLKLESVAVVNPADASKDDVTPKWNQLFVNGTRYRPDFPDGAITFDTQFFDTMVANFQRFKTLAGAEAKLPVDYAHDEGGIAAGWIIDLKLTSGVVYALIDWTQRARAAIEAKELQFLSPTFSVDGWDPTTGTTQGPTLYGAALLNTPFLFDLPSVTAGREAPVTPTPAPEADTKELSMLKKLLLSLGLPEDSKEEKAVEAIAALQAKAAVDVEKTVELSATPLRAELAASKGEVARLTKEMAELKADAFDKSVKALCDSLVESKKVLPAQRDSVVEYARTLGLEKAKTFFSSLPGTVVPVGEKGIKGTETELSPEEASLEWQAKLDELQAKGISPVTAFKQLSKQHPDLLARARAVVVKQSA